MKRIENRKKASYEVFQSNKTLSSPVAESPWHLLRKGLLCIRNDGICMMLKKVAKYFKTCPDTCNSTLHVNVGSSGAFFNFMEFIDACVSAGGECFCDEVLEQIPGEEWVLLVSHQLNLTGAPIALKHFAQSILDMGKKPLIIAPQDDKLRGILCEEGIPVIILPDVYTSDILAKAAHLFDLLVVNTIIGAPIIATLSGKSTPVLWWIHEAQVSYHPGVMEFLPTELGKNIHVYCGGQYAENILRQNCPSYSCKQLLYYIPDISKGGIISNYSPNVTEEKTVFAIVGTLEQRKGQDIVVKAIEMLPPEQRAKSVFFFVGKQHYVPLYEDIIRAKESYPNCVHYIPELYSQDLFGLYERMDCLICSSRDDPMPMVVIDAMALSKTVICSENTGSAKLIEKYDAGIIYQNNDANELAMCITKVRSMVNSEFYQMHKNARKLYEENFTPEVFKKNVKSIFSQLTIAEDVDEIPYHGTVSVVIPTFNASKQFPLLLHKLQAQENIENVELVIIDSGSSDETVLIAKQSGAKVIEIPKTEFSHSHTRNLGVENAIGEYVLFMTQDAMPKGNRWLSRLLQPLLKEKVVAVSCKQTPRADCDLLGAASIWVHNNYMEIMQNDRILELPQVKNYDNMRKNAQLDNVACIVRRDILQKYPYRGEYAEDLDFGLRLIRDGYKLALLSSVQVIHSHARSALYYMKRGFVDIVTLKKLFPDFQIEKFDECCCVNCIISYFLALLCVSDELEVVTENVKDMRSLCCTLEDLLVNAKSKLKKYSLETIHQKMEKPLPFDSSLQTFLFKLSLAYLESFCFDTGILERELGYVRTTLISYFADAGRLFTKNTVSEVMTALIQHFGWTCGYYLFCYLNHYSTEKNSLIELIKEYCTGV